MKLFREKAPVYMRKLMAEQFGFSLDDAAAIFGNLGHECAGFTLMQEQKPTVPGSVGGYGWAQWTGVRRREFEAWAKRKGWMPWSDEANYSFLIRELLTTEARAVEAVKSADGLRAKVEAFERAYERAGIKHYDSRMKWAEIARDAYLAAEAAKAAKPAAPTPKEPDMPAPLATVLGPILIKVIGEAVDKALTKTATDKGSPVPEVVAAPEVKREVKAEVVAEVAKSPEVQHATNTEPHWYQKRSRWASIVGIVFTVAAPIAAMFGLDLAPNTQELVVTVCTTLGGLWAAYLAYRAGVATKPLGS